MGNEQQTHHRIKHKREPPAEFTLWSERAAHRLPILMTSEEIQDQVRKRLSDECSHTSLIKIACTYNISTQDEVKRWELQRLLDAIVQTFNDEDNEAIIAAFRDHPHKSDLKCIWNCAWCHRPYSVLQTSHGAYPGWCCDRDSCNELRRNARDEYELFWGKCRELNRNENIRFCTKLGVPGAELYRHVPTKTKEIPVSEVVLAHLDSRKESWLSVVREIDEKYRNVKDTSGLFDEFFDLVRILCDYCGEPWLVIWRDQNTARYCERYLCKREREEARAEFRDTYDKRTPLSEKLGKLRWHFKKDREFNSNLHSIWGIPKTELRWIKKAVRNPHSCLDRLRFLDEKYRQGRDPSDLYGMTTMIEARVFDDLECEGQ